MRGSITVDRAANSIRLQRDIHKGAFLLVEGRSDRIFYEQRVDQSSCIVRSFEGKPSSKQRVIDILAILEKSGFEGVLAIVDADFDRLLPPEISSANLLMTDDHDLEAMLVKSPAFEKVISEFCSEEKVQSFGQDIRQVILKSGISVGFLRWFSHCDGLNLTFNGISFSKFTSDESLKIDETTLLKEVRNKSQLFSLSVEDMQQKIIEVKNVGHDPWQVCCGHDLVELLSIGLRKAIGSNNASTAGATELERCLRLAYEQVHWIKTQLYFHILAWENTNHPYKVLPTAV